MLPIMAIGKGLQQLLFSRISDVTASDALIESVTEIICVFMVVDRKASIF